MDGSRCLVLAVLVMERNINTRCQAGPGSAEDQAWRGLQLDQPYLHRQVHYNKILNCIADFVGSMLLVA